MGRVRSWLCQRPPLVAGVGAGLPTMASPIMTPAVSVSEIPTHIVMERYLEGHTVELLKARAAAGIQVPQFALSAEEKAVLAFLQTHLRVQKTPVGKR